MTPQLGRLPGGAVIAIRTGRLEEHITSDVAWAADCYLAWSGDEAFAGDAVTITLADEIDIARGDILARPDSRPEVADQFTAHVIWMSAEPMLPGRSYLLKLGARTTPASPSTLGAEYSRRCGRCGPSPLALIAGACPSCSSGASAAG